MAGIYLHIPFCRQACHYCNFHFSTSLRLKNDLLIALQHEITLQQHYLPQKEIATVYFGGGTPSLLSGTEIEGLLNQIQQYYTILPDAEITLEANPDDLTPQKLTELKQAGVNRLSIGIQSFFDADLQYMNRAHNATQALQCIVAAQNTGFTNLSIDLIYATPTLTPQQWLQNLQTAVHLHIPHVSAYCLTVEPKTALQAYIQKGIKSNIDEESAALHFDLLRQTLLQNGYLHYEISNFCLPGFVSRHNSSYWQQQPYLGIGPSAHSYNQTERSWNIANNAAYIKAIAQNKLPAQSETLTPQNRFNEYVMTSLRTSWGCNLQAVQQQFGDIYYQHLLKQSRQYLAQQQLTLENDVLYLHPDAQFVADAILAGLFV